MRYYLVMKTLQSYLQEGILDIDDEKLDKMTDSTAALEWVEKYLKPHNPNVRFKLNSKGEIRLENNIELKIVFDGFDELPEYVSFSDQRISKIGILAKGDSKIKSFRGLPSKARKIIINVDRRAGKVNMEGKMPDWSIDVSGDFYLFGSDITSFENFEIKCGNGSILKLSTSAETLKGLKITGENVILDFVNDFNIGDKISKLLNRKAQMNKYRGKFDEPITSEGLDAITSLFNGVVNLKNVFRINYTQNSCLEKHDGKFYRCKIGKL